MFEIVDKVCLVVVTAFQGNLAPVNGLIRFDGIDHSLKAHELEILLGRYSHLLPEQVDEVFLRVPDVIA
jgi:hypothetical protein